MTGRVRRLHSPDIADLDAWVPPNPDSFGFLLQVIAGEDWRDAQWVRGPIPVADPVKAAEFAGTTARLVVEVPPLGYAWVPR